MELQGRRFLIQHIAKGTTIGEIVTMLERHYHQLIKTEVSLYQLQVIAMDLNLP
jgi:hypothetical protein